MSTEYLPSTVESEEALVNAYAKIEARRELVWEMMIQGVPETKMAKELGVDRKTIHRDVLYWRQTLGEHVSKLKTSKDHVTEEIGITLKRLDWIFQNAAMEYQASSVAMAKNRFLNTALSAELARLKVQVETGYLPKAGVKVTVEAGESVQFAALFGSKASAMDDPVKRRKAMEIATKMISVAPSRVTKK